MELTQGAPLGAHSRSPWGTPFAIHPYTHSRRPSKQPGGRPTGEPAGRSVCQPLARLASRPADSLIGHLASRRPARQQPTDVVGGAAERLCTDRARQGVMIVDFGLDFPGSVDQCLASRPADSLVGHLASRCPTRQQPTDVVGWRRTDCALMARDLECVLLISDRTGMPGFCANSGCPRIRWPVSTTMSSSCVF